MGNMDSKENRAGGDGPSTSKMCKDDIGERIQRCIDGSSRVIWMANPREKRVPSVLSEEPKPSKKKRRRRKKKIAKREPEYEHLTHHEKLLYMAKIMDNVITDADEIHFVDMDRLDEVHDGLKDLAKEYKQSICQQEELISLLRSKNYLLETQKSLKDEVQKELDAEKVYQKVYTEEIMKIVEARVVRILEARPSKTQLEQLKDVLKDCIVPIQIKLLVWEYEGKMVKERVEKLVRFK